MKIIRVSSFEAYIVGKLNEYVKDVTKLFLFQKEDEEIF